MEIDITFTCKCGAFIDQTIACDGPDRSFYTDEQSQKQYWHTFICDGCFKDYDASIFCTLSDTKIDIPEVIDLNFDVCDLIEEADLINEIECTNQLEKYKKVSTDIVSLLRQQYPKEAKATLNNMLYAQVITAIEAYLSSSFISTVMKSEELIKRLIETDPELAKRQFSLKEIFTQWNNLKITVAKYLMDLIFHDFKKVKPMYLSILDIDFGDIGWLFKSVHVRHDCVHRNGFNKNGDQNIISDEDIVDLVKKATHLISEVEEQLISRSQTLDSFPQTLSELLNSNIKNT